MDEFKALYKEEKQRVEGALRSVYKQQLASSSGRRPPRTAEEKSRARDKMNEWCTMMLSQEVKRWRGDLKKVRWEVVLLVSLVRMFKNRRSA